MLRLRTEAAVIALGSYLFVCTGRDLSGPNVLVSDSCERFNLPFNRWSSIAQTNYPRYNAAGVACNGRLFLFGGKGRDDKPISVPEVYDPNDDRWLVCSDEKSTTLTMGSCTASVRGDRIVVLGLASDNNDGTFLLTEFDPNALQWTSVIRLAVAGTGVLRLIVLYGNDAVIFGQKGAHGFFSKYPLPEPSTSQPLVDGKSPETVVLETYAMYAQCPTMAFEHDGQLFGLFPQENASHTHVFIWQSDQTSCVWRPHSVIRLGALSFGSRCTQQPFSSL